MRIAVIDDDKEFIDTIKKYIAAQSEESGTKHSVFTFTNAIDFLESFRGDYDVVFLDIDMPLMNGLDAARKLREIDKAVCIIFITSMAQYAINGYEVNALDYIVKPLSYSVFRDKMSRAENYLSKNASSKIIIRNKSRIFALTPEEIYYITKDKNYICYHTTQGEIKERGTITDAEKKVPLLQFAKITYGCLVNLAHVESFDNDSVKTGKEVLFMSRAFSRSFIKKCMEYISNE